VIFKIFLIPGWGSLTKLNSYLRKEGLSQNARKRSKITVLDLLANDFLILN
jgi:hypothetical protein